MRVRLVGLTGKRGGKRLHDLRLFSFHLLHGDSERSIVKVCPQSTVGHSVIVNHQRLQLISMLNASEQPESAVNPSDAQEGSHSSVNLRRQKNKRKSLTPRCHFVSRSSSADPSYAEMGVEAALNLSQRRQQQQQVLESELPDMTAFEIARNLRSVFGILAKSAPQPERVGRTSAKEKSCRIKHRRQNTEPLSAADVNSAQKVEGEAQGQQGLLSKETEAVANQPSWSEVDHSAQAQRLLPGSNDSRKSPLSHLSPERLTHLRRWSDAQSEQSDSSETFSSSKISLNREDQSPSSWENEESCSSKEPGCRNLISHEDTPEIGANSETPNLNYDVFKNLVKYSSFLECKSDTCSRENLRDHLHCYDLACLGMVISCKADLVRHVKWHRKRNDSLAYGFLRYTSTDDCCASGAPCHYNRRQTHYHCSQPNCQHVCVNTSDVQTHARSHRKAAATTHEGFPRFRSKDEKNKHSTYDLKTSQSSSDDHFLRVLKPEHCSSPGCPCSAINNHMHCAREHCSHVSHSITQLLSHKRKHDRLDNVQAFWHYKLLTAQLAALLSETEAVSGNEMLVAQSCSNITTSTQASKEAVASAEALLQLTLLKRPPESLSDTADVAPVPTPTSLAAIMTTATAADEATCSAAALPTSGLEAAAQHIQITTIDGFFNRKRGRPPKNRFVEVYKNTQPTPQAIFTSFKLEKSGNSRTVVNCPQTLPTNAVSSEPIATTSTTAAEQHDFPALSPADSGPEKLQQPAERFSPTRSSTSELCNNVELQTCSISSLGATSLGASSAEGTSKRQQLFNRKLLSLATSNLVNQYERYDRANGLDCGIAECRLRESRPHLHCKTCLHQISPFDMESHECTPSNLPASGSFLSTMSLPKIADATEKPGTIVRAAGTFYPENCNCVASTDSPSPAVQSDSIIKAFFQLKQKRKTETNADVFNWPLLKDSTKPGGSYSWQRNKKLKECSMEVPQDLRLSTKLQATQVLSKASSDCDGSSTAYVTNRPNLDPYQANSDPNSYRATQLGSLESPCHKASSTFAQLHPAPDSPATFVTVADSPQPPAVSNAILESALAKRLVESGAALQPPAGFKLRDDRIPVGYLKFRFNEDCGFPKCGYRNHQSHFHCNRNDCHYSFCDKTRFVQHTARHERLDTLMGKDFRQFRANMCCGYDKCVYLKNTGPSKKSSHFHCLKCDFICSDTNKVVAHRRQHSKMEYIRQAGFRKVASNENCSLSSKNVGYALQKSAPGSPDVCSYCMKQTHYHCLFCDGGVLSRSQLSSHKHRIATPSVVEKERN